MKANWKYFIDTLPHPVEYFHRDEFLQKYLTKKGASFPAVFMEENDQVIHLLSKSDIDACKTILELSEKITATISQLHPQ